MIRPHQPIQASTTEDVRVNKYSLKTAIKNIIYVSSDVGSAIILAKSAYNDSFGEDEVWQVGILKSMGMAFHFDFLNDKLIKSLEKFATITTQGVIYSMAINFTYQSSNIEDLHANKMDSFYCFKDSNQSSTIEDLITQFSPSEMVNEYSCFKNSKSFFITSLCMLVPTMAAATIIGLLELLIRPCTTQPVSNAVPIAHAIEIPNST